MPRKFKGKNKVTIYPDWCKGCGICVEFCPGKVLDLGPDGKAVVKREADCIRCGFCELHCPDFAIVVSHKEPMDNGLSEQDAEILPPKKKTAGKGA
ncbi:4Fe-4S binding protein [Pseudodesulfovibrio thermohalotolerans]|uniref:4Fe-4S dicluster domain-containing protein n=1 Tax=Pseudodesulfovibrio thermohalotolerans TaxID=2880651 RepID=UPI002440F2B9|nr:4Fe-4S binding protein [Pseudodesulfovibrio thermohalotolerans]WFS63892.1 4Fe-4S binding protein [Pseudodesulfovibrio thermohalotolerans]